MSDWVITSNTYRRILLEGGLSVPLMKSKEEVRQEGVVEFLTCFLGCVEGFSAC